MYIYALKRFATTKSYAIGINKVTADDEDRIDFWIEEKRVRLLTEDEALQLEDTTAPIITNLVDL